MRALNFREHFGLQNRSRLVVVVVLVLVFVAGSSELFMLSCRIGGGRLGPGSKLQTKLHSANAAEVTQRKKVQFVFISNITNLFSFFNINNFFFLILNHLIWLV